MAQDAERIVCLLLVDDESSHRILASAILKMEGVLSEVAIFIEAASVDGAEHELDKLAAAEPGQRPDDVVVMTDYNFPRVREAREDDPTGKAAAPLAVFKAVPDRGFRLSPTNVVMTASIHDDGIEGLGFTPDAMERYGTVDLVDKPFDIPRFAQAARTAIAACRHNV